MKKEIMIAFRTNNGLRQSLQKVAKEERRSMSSVIEMMIEEGLRAKKLSPDADRRMFRRHEYNLPALIRSSEQETPQSGTILDISLGGMKISVSRQAKIEMENGEGDFYITFPLSADKSTMALKCRQQWINQHNGDVDIGLSFDDCKFADYRRLQRYLA